MVSDKFSGLRIKILFEGKTGKVRLPVHYNRLIQGLVYSVLPDDFATSLHNLKISGKQIKFFTFSRLIPLTTLSVKGKTIEFVKGFYLIFSTLFVETAHKFVEGLLTRGEINLNGQELTVSQIKVLPSPEYKPLVLLRTISPITVYKRGTVHRFSYLSPHDEEFCKLLEENIKTKLNVLGINSDVGKIKIFKEDRVKKRIILFKSTAIEAWDCTLQVSLTEQAFKVAFFSGFGYKNSLGFGCVEVVGRKGM